jgi:SpoVK/Ycf46/Vps4 family AAA+-type ATPase
MGPNMSTPTDSLHTGLFVYRDLGEVNKNNFSDPQISGSRFVVEIRESSLYQTDMVEFVTQISTILGQGKTLPPGDLLYEVYYDLIRLGLKDVDHSSIYGMDDAINTIKRSLLIPLASRDLSHGIKQQPESVLMVGVPGTGKTLAVEEILQEETGVFILPIDPLELVKELNEDKDRQTLLPRISDVSRKTGKRVVLHVDDIENMVQNEQSTHSTLLNLMAGIRENDFYIIASTNDPEKIDTALLQPQRFGVLIYCGLPNEDARREIINIHTNELSQKLGIPLFANPDMREVILDAVTRETKDFTPRYIAEIANVAKSHLLFRIAQEQGQTIGLTEEALQRFSFTPEDWREAFLQVSARYNKEEVRSRDTELEKFVSKCRRGLLGLPYPTDGIKSQVLFSREELKKLHELSTDTQEKLH